MHSLTISLDDELHAGLLREAAARGVTPALVVRNALEQFLTPKRKRPRSLGLGRSKRGDLSERAEELLVGLGTQR